MKKSERKYIAKNKALNRGIYRGVKWLVGIDEVGRGPLAGPVAVCACAIPYHKSVKESYKKFLGEYKEKIKKRGLPLMAGCDSKKLSAAHRKIWKDFLCKSSHAVFFYHTEGARKIDTKGIAVCIRSIIKKNLKYFIKKHKVMHDEVHVLLDGGLKAPKEFINQQTIIKGDEKEMVISFASIYAKVTRDGHMVRLAKKYPQYGFEVHKGYGTSAHRQTISREGVCVEHRKTFCSKLTIK